MYLLLRKLLFLLNAEKAHEFSMKTFSLLIKIPFFKNYIKRKFAPASPKTVSVFGLSFPNCAGLAAGFDKNAQYLDALSLLGFGFIEIGTVTPLAQDGNTQPRLFRLKKDRALINRMGFNNEGVKVAASNIRKFKAKNSSLIIGGNIGKNKVTPNEDAWKDYELCFKELHDTVDYFVVNVSSPNTPGLRELQQANFLRNILTNLQRINMEGSIQRPILLKISPDLERNQLDEILNLALEINLDGLVVANTTLSREGLLSVPELKAQAGGLSGAPLNKVSYDLLCYILGKTNKQIPVISSGGIFSVEDVASRINAGASLVQVWTAFVYEGPGIVKKILR
jgi:dihydroorotate dehydrogenase